MGFGDLGDFEAGDLREELAGLLVDALCVTEVAGVVVGDADGQRIARGDRLASSQRISEMSLHFAEKAAARAAHAGSSRRRWPYSFMVEPQPAALMTMVSTLAASKMAMMLACHGGGLVFEAGVDHEGAAAGLVACGMMTSKPSAARTRAVAALTCGKKTCCTQPVSMPTRRRDWGGGGDACAEGVPGEVCGDVREQGFHGGEAFGEELEQAGGADEGLQAGALVERRVERP